ncbi:MAG TPA: malto-oligosyltrehalose trehalohydrolase, partial [Kofleriaceae bacterium]|nr:malto-oligosyltrehalose trehalohydrolase [Kofleriaceae bacterium]
MHLPFPGAPGAQYLGDHRCRFSVWAPAARRVEVHIAAPEDRLIVLDRQPDGMFAADAAGVAPGTRYFFRLDGKDDLPDPASRHQPDGVFGPSAVIDTAFAWTAPRPGVPAAADLVIYELHVGTFSAAGTFDGAIPYLDALADLGVTAIELCPIAEFPGARNWGYDGVFAYAAQSTYGGPEGLFRLVDAAHARGLAVLLDVVYNHVGPEGNVLARFGPYFTAGRTPWGEAINFDGSGSDEVRAYFIESALYYMTELGIDGFRVDAIHAICDHAATPFVAALAAAIHERAAALGTRTMVIAESDLNDPRVIAPADGFGFGMDAQWSDDFHHALAAKLTGERAGYYADFGTLGDLARAFCDGFVLIGQRSRFRGRSHGRPAPAAGGERFVVFSQNHDQVGNRPRGDRLALSVTPAAQRVTACALLIAPYIPLLFMGQEYGETAPFPYFTSHADATLGRAVKAGRASELSAFGWPEACAWDPQDPGAFAAAKLDPGRGDSTAGRGLRALYGELLRLRKAHLWTDAVDRFATRAVADEARQTVTVYREGAGVRWVCVLAFGTGNTEVAIDFGPGPWRQIL